jgi:amidophosphoribosyltransferase
MIDDISVYKTRLRMGEHLAPQIKAADLQIDSVIPIPDTSRPTAIALAQSLGIPYREGFIKNRYIGRTFIMPGQEERKRSIRQKLSPVTLEFRNKNVLLVDDSIVRGNTSREIVNLARKAGAKNVYFASAAPPIINPDVYGVDIPTRAELIANNRTVDAICKEINADRLFYQTIENLVKSASEGSEKTNEFHTGCFDFGYPTPEVTEELLNQMEKENSDRDE